MQPRPSVNPHDYVTPLDVGAYNLDDPFQREVFCLALAETAELLLQRTSTEAALRLRYAVYEIRAAALILGDDRRAYERDLKAGVA